MNLKIFNVYILTLCVLCINAFVRDTTKNELRNQKLAPCQACRIFSDSFKKGMDRTARYKTDGGDTAWEEKKVPYKKSETRFVEIFEELCLEIERGKTQCEKHAEDHETLIFEDWWNNQDLHPDIFKWLCIDKLEVCCAEKHYGPKCLPCSKLKNNEICSGNGKCKGDGTRLGNGDCSCNKGYEGELCDECSLGFYELKNESSVSCKQCNEACENSCSGGGPKLCDACKKGWNMDPQEGCLDINECENKEICKENEFCRDSPGSYSCHKCHAACDGCLANGPDTCIRCAEGYLFKEGLCIDKSMKQRAQNVIYARYATYLGLTLAPCIILQRHTVIAAVIGLLVAAYISFSEYYLTYLSTDKQFNF